MGLSSISSRSKVLPESTPLRLQGFTAEEIWNMGDDRRIVIYDMETSHLLNAVRFVESLAKQMLESASMADKFEARVFAKKALTTRYPCYPRMLNELEKRLSEPKVEPPKHARVFNFE